MGCDIRAAIERRVDGHWRADHPLELDRNYHLFGILAGVRRHHEPIAQPRGLPADLDPASCSKPWHKDPTHRYYDPKYSCLGGEDEFGDHSHSWLTLAELRTYGWDQLLVDEGCIPLREGDRRMRSCDNLTSVTSARWIDHRDYEETYVDWIKSPPHFPKGCCGGLSGAQILDLRPWELVDAADPNGRRRRIADQRIAERLLADPKLMPEPEDPPPGAIYGPRAWKMGKKYPRTAWANVAWALPARENCRQFCAWLDAQVSVDGDDLRIVFGFSS